MKRKEEVSSRDVIAATIAATPYELTGLALIGSHEAWAMTCILRCDTTPEERDHPNVQQALQHLRRRAEEGKALAALNAIAMDTPEHMESLSVIIEGSEEPFHRR